MTDPYVAYIQEILDRYPRLRATRVYEMVRDRGYEGSVVQLRRVVRTLRPLPFGAERRRGCERCSIG
jgi:hypothetical protein